MIASHVSETCVKRYSTGLLYQHLRALYLVML